MTDHQPLGFLLALGAFALLGALLPMRVERREDHVVLAIITVVVFAVLGPVGLAVLWPAALLAAAVQLGRGLLPPDSRFALSTSSRRAALWVLLAAVAHSAGFLSGDALYRGLLHQSYPVRIDGWPELGRALAFGAVAALVAGGIGVLSQVVGRDESSGRALDPFDSMLIPYLWPYAAGVAVVSTCLAVYRPGHRWLVMVPLAWSLPIHALAAFDVRRRRLAQALRRDAAARQRLAAIGEVSARIVHQSRHQVALMGWSIHRLRTGIDDLADAGVASPGQLDALRHELDELTDARHRLVSMLMAELSAPEGDPVLGVPLAFDDGPPPLSSATTLGEVAVEVVAQLGPKADDRGIRVEVDVDATDASLEAPDTLADVLFNLVDNALDAARTTVEVRLTDPAGPTDHVEVVVADDGRGLDGITAGRAFEPFSTTKPDGTGMGLAIAEALVGDLGGRVAYEHAAGRTTFVVALPRHSLEAPQLLDLP